MAAHRYSKYMGKKIRVKCNRKDWLGRDTYEGKCFHCGWAFDNDPEIDSLGLDSDGILYELFEDEIVSIEVLD